MIKCAFSFSLVLVLTGCFASAPDGTCKKTRDCYAGDVCLEGRCHTLCTTQANCSGDTYCDVDGMCRPRVTAGPTPRIDAITGNAPGDEARIADSIVVTGEHLDAAAMELMSAGGAVALEARSRAATRVELVVPVDVVSGEYTLTATNASGSASQALTLTLPEVTPAQVLEKLNAATGEVVLARLPEALVTEAELLASHGSESCPAGYAHDPSRADIVVCKRGADEMVKVGDVWVDRYEATVWSTQACTGTAYGQQDNDAYPATFPRSGNVASAASRLFACSVAGELPSAELTYFQAQQACAASGKRLISNDVWQMAAASTFDPGAYDGHTGPLCNNTSSGARATGLGASTTASPGCESLYGAQDMVGNVVEWTAEWWSVGMPWVVEDGQGAKNWPTGFGSDDGTWGMDGRAWDGTRWVTGVPVAGYRGGCWVNGADGGVFSIRLFSSPAEFNECIGFRCMRGR